MSVGPPFNEFAARVVRNNECMVLVRAIKEQGGLDKLKAAVDEARYPTDHQGFRDGYPPDPASMKER